jgi:hypothetical protein
MVLALAAFVLRLWMLDARWQEEELTISGYFGASPSSSSRPSLRLAVQRLGLPLRLAVQRLGLPRPARRGRLQRPHTQPLENRTTVPSAFELMWFGDLRGVHKWHSETVETIEGRAVQVVV